MHGAFVLSNLAGGAFVLFVPDFLRAPRPIMNTRLRKSKRVGQKFDWFRFLIATPPQLRVTRLAVGGD
jgi:hypothetical protein